MEEQQIVLPSRTQMPALASLSVIWAGDDQDIYCSMVRSTLKGLLTADIRAFLTFIFFFFFQQEIPVKSLSGFMMLSDCGPQPYSAHGKPGFPARCPPLPVRSKGHRQRLPPRQWVFNQPSSVLGTAELALLPCTLERTPRSSWSLLVSIETRKNLFFCENFPLQLFLALYKTFIFCYHSSPFIASFNRSKNNGLSKDERVLRVQKPNLNVH